MHQTRVAIGSERLFAKSKWQTRDVGRPEKILLSDWPMWIILAGYGVSAVVVVLLRHIVIVSSVG